MGSADQSRVKILTAPPDQLPRLSSTFSADLGLSSVEGAVEEVLDLSRAHCIISNLCAGVFWAYHATRCTSGPEQT